MNINGNMTKACDTCQYRDHLGANSQCSQLYGCKKMTGKCPAAEKDKKPEAGSRDYREHFVNRFMKRR